MRVLLIFAISFSYVLSLPVPLNGNSNTSHTVTTPSPTSAVVPSPSKTPEATPEYKINIPFIGPQPPWVVTVIASVLGLLLGLAAFAYIKRRNRGVRDTGDSDQGNTGKTKSDSIGGEGTLLHKMMQQERTKHKIRVPTAASNHANNNNNNAPSTSNNTVSSSHPPLTRVGSMIMQVQLVNSSNAIQKPAPAATNYTVNSHSIIDSAELTDSPSELKNEDERKKETKSTKTTYVEAAEKMDDSDRESVESMQSIRKSTTKRSRSSSIEKDKKPLSREVSDLSSLSAASEIS
jgi:hypothetical protein